MKIQEAFKYDNGLFRIKTGREIRSARVPHEGKSYKTARIVYELCKGIPKGYVVRQKEKGNDYRIENLVAMPYDEHCRQRKDASFATGIQRVKNRFVAHCWYKGKNLYVGTFKSIREAVEKRAEFKKHLTKK